LPDRFALTDRAIASVVLMLPARPPELVYLDMLHWIALAKAHAGHRDGKRHEETLVALIRARESGSALFPISDSIFFERSQIRQHRQRRDLRDVIELLSQYFVVTSRSVISVHEIEALLDDLVGPTSRPINEMNYLDWGVARAFGIVGGFASATRPEPTSPKAPARRIPAGRWSSIDFWPPRTLNSRGRVLAGPTLEEEPHMRSLGWRPGSESGVEEQRAEQEREQQDRLRADPRWREAAYGTLSRHVKS
jgi:hypothetical protein